MSDKLTEDDRHLILYALDKLSYKYSQSGQQYKRKKVDGLIEKLE
jgi:hypothetical protein